MNLLVIDGNSLINRAFFGIKLLTAKDGHYTNAIFGFFNMLFSLCDEVHPDGIAVAFDLKAPTFRHKMYEGYKAGRKGMPPELFEQMEPIKNLLTAFGYHIVSVEGYEADDILGTISAACDEHTHCFIATGDRDSLQLVRDNVTVLLTSTKMGSTVLTHYTPEKIKEDYGVTPQQMIEIKALQGDSSDNIPGVAGIGPKTAGDLITKYGSIAYIYDNLSAIEVTENIRKKLENDRKNAFLSHTLGTICLSAPIEKNPLYYKNIEPDRKMLLQLLTKHELFKLIKKLELDTIQPTADNETESVEGIPLTVITDDSWSEIVKDRDKLYFTPVFNENSICACVVCTDSCLGFYADSQPQFTENIKKIVSDNTIRKYTIESKRIFAWAFKNGGSVENICFDVALAGYLLNPNASSYSVHDLILSYQIPHSTVISEGTDDIYQEYHDLFDDCASFQRLCTIMESMLETNSQTELLREIEIPLACVLASMENRGFRVNRNGIDAFAARLKNDITQMEENIFEQAGIRFNINSPKQLGEVLFEKMQLPHGKKTKTGYSTNADILEGLADSYPIVGDVLKYRTYSKLLSTYCDGMRKQIEADGRIRSTFNQTETRTGRLSSSEPNLQNIPVRTELGREMRRFFEAGDGYVLVDADYSQIELRVLAAVSEDIAMCEAFNSGKDIHTSTAAEVFHMPVDMITPLMRSRAKAVNFGIVYGIGAFSLSKDIGVSRKEAENYINDYLRLYSGVKKYLDFCVAKAKECGYAETILHRRRSLPELKSSNANLRSFGERVAMNMPIQGTAADIIKIAMIRVYKRLRTELPDASLIMQVHDELILEVREADAEKASAILREEMENALPLKVKLPADVHIGKTWYDAKG